MRRVRLTSYREKDALPYASWWACLGPANLVLDHPRMTIEMLDNDENWSGVCLELYAKAIFDPVVNYEMTLLMAGLVEEIEVDL